MQQSRSCMFITFYYDFVEYQESECSHFRLASINIRVFLIRKPFISYPSYRTKTPIWFYSCPVGLDSVLFCVRMTLKIWFCFIFEDSFNYLMLICPPPLLVQLLNFEHFHTPHICFAHLHKCKYKHIIIASFPSNQIWRDDSLLLWNH